EIHRSADSKCVAIVLFDLAQCRRGKTAERKNKAVHRLVQPGRQLLPRKRDFGVQIDALAVEPGMGQAVRGDEDTTAGRQALKFRPSAMAVPARPWAPDSAVGLG